MTRRKFIYTNSIFLTGLLMSANGKSITKEKQSFEFYMPEESHKHKQTWISFVANDYIWSKKQIAEVKRNLSLITKTIAKYEPVSVLLSSHDKNKAMKLLDGLDSHNYPITLVEKDIDDLWLRDTAPTFVYNKKNEKLGVDFNFNGWGEDQEHTLDSTVTKFICEKANIKRVKSDLVLEGG